MLNSCQLRTVPYWKWQKSIVSNSWWWRFNMVESQASPSTKPKQFVLNMDYLQYLNLNTRIRSHLINNTQPFLVGGFTPFKKISQIGSFPQIGVKIKNIRNHHLVLNHTMSWKIGILKTYLKTTPFTSALPVGIPRPLLVAQVPRMGTCHPPSPMVGCCSPNIFAWDLCRVGVEEVWDFVWICVFDPPRVQHDIAPENIPKLQKETSSSYHPFSGVFVLLFQGR